MFAKPSQLMFTIVLGLLFSLLSLPLSVSALPAPVPAPEALPAVVAHPVIARATNPTSLLGRTYHANPNVARAEGTEGPIMVLRAADTGVDADAEPIKRSERFQIRMERQHARRLASRGVPSA